MTIQWPSEREAANRKSIANAPFKTERDFRQLLDAGPKVLPATFDEAVLWVIQQNGEVIELEQRMSAVCIQANLQNFPDSTNLLMTWACAVALAQSPSLQTWGKVKDLKYHSWELAHWLVPAMLFHAEVNSEVHKAYIDLAKETFGALDSFALVSKSDRTSEERANALAFWKECQGKLDEIWWGLRGWNGFMNYEEEFPLFQVLSKLAPDELANILAQSANPYLVDSILLLSGAGAFSSQFAQWEKLIASAPPAFESDGSWNGSVLVPLLLVEARDQLLNAGRGIPLYDASSNEVERVKQEIANIVEAVVSALVMRPDSLPLFTRWSTWLMRQLLSHSGMDISDVRSDAFVDDALIEAIGCKLKEQDLIQVSPSDASAWEAWCYRCVLSSHAHSGYVDPPDSTVFLAEWSISHDEWAGEKGERLRERANLIIPMNKEMPGIAAHSLAYPIVRSISPTEAWIGMWDATHTLREIVEFGDTDALIDEYHSRSEAGKLLLLVFRIGLAVLDQRAVQCQTSDSLEARSQAKLHEALSSAVYEMREIDDTLNREEWFTAFRHLAIRRLNWEMQVCEGPKVGRFPVFRPEDAPTFSDYLTATRNDGFELLSVLQSVLLNDPNIPQLQNRLRKSLCNLSNTLGIVRRLNQYSPRRYPIDEAQLQRIEGLVV